jgi:2-polyprenyl-3-methyl-5-hydroxy-6-metoxy-1,4-benzoquinol methylase
VSLASKPKSDAFASHYDANYGNFRQPLYEQIRHDAFGEDIGQNSWLTAGEQDRFIEWLRLSTGQQLLDVACGAGGPVLRIAALTGCSITGVDVHEQAIATASALAAQRNLAAVATFQIVDASQPLPFKDDSFDAITCIDAINHLPDRSRVISDWARMLKPGGRLLFTDPIVVTGALSSTEIAVRSSAGFYLFVPPALNERLVNETGLELIACENRTHNMAEIAERRMAARQAQELALLEIEGEQAFRKQQEFLRVASLLAREQRLSRFSFVAEKTGGLSCENPI